VMQIDLGASYVSQGASTCPMQDDTAEGVMAARIVSWRKRRFLWPLV
jgi:hypothetical protein